MQKQIKNKLS